MGLTNAGLGTPMGAYASQPGGYIVHGGNCEAPLPPEVTVSERCTWLENDTAQLSLYVQSLVQAVLNQEMNARHIDIQLQAREDESMALLARIAELEHSAGLGPGTSAVPSTPAALPPGVLAMPSIPAGHPPGVLGMPSMPAGLPPSVLTIPSTPAGFPPGALAMPLTPAMPPPLVLAMPTEPPAPTWAADNVNVHEHDRSPKEEKGEKEEGEMSSQQELGKKDVN